MQFTFFHLMPYRPLDMAERHKHRAGWVVLPNNLYDAKKGADEYQSYIDQLIHAERLGFDVIAVNEHHQTAYGLMPAPNLIASALIQLTKKAKIAIIGRALPLVNNPINIAEEFAMLDNLSRGRIITGFVRGIGNEYHATGINPYFSHERFQEAHDLIVQAWSRPGPFSFEGEHYNIRYVNLWPRPYQTPHPPIWIPSMGSSETIKWAAAPERKYPFLVTFSGRDLVARYLNLYREQARQYGYEASPDQIGWASPVYVADSDERARAEAKAGIESLFNDFLATPFQMLLPPGYMSLSSMKNTMRLRKALGARARLSIDELIENGTVVVGSPRTVRDQLARLRDETGANKLVTMLQFGVLSDELTRRNMEMFTSEVMPHLRWAPVRRSERCLLMAALRGQPNCADECLLSVGDGDADLRHARCGHGWGTADELGSSSKVLGGSCEQRLVPNTAQHSQSQKPDRSLQEQGLINCGHL